MGLYDIIDEITDRQMSKTETGDTRIFGVMIGIVAVNYHKDMPGRVCVTIPTRDKDANELKWARLAMDFGGSAWGSYFLPEVGDQVLLAFEGGNIECPYVIGCVAKDNDKFLTGSVDADNQTKRIVTKHGNTITFTDHKEDEKGQKDKIMIQTAQERHTLIMDNENEVIRIEEKNNQNIIELNTSKDDGSLTVKIKSQIHIEVGDTISISLNGESGMVKISAKQISLQGSDMVGIKTDQMVSLDGAQVKIKAGSILNMESGGAVSLSGTPIKIG